MGAGQNFPCPGCGAELMWTPGASGLTCEYCGHEVQAEAANQPYVATEHRLDQAAVSAARGWGADMQEFQCDACGAISEVDAKLTATSCGFCGNDKLDLAESHEDVIRPESVVAFSVEKDKAVDDFQAWISGLWFRPNALKQLARLEKIAGIYVPCWTYDAHTRSHWTAEAGYYYYVTETYTTQENGRSVQKTRQVRKTRWEPAVGRHAKFFDDVLVSASRGLEQKLFEGLEPFRLEQLKQYDTQYLAGFTAERYQLALQDGYGVAKGKMESTIRSECASMVPGDTHRNLRVNSHFSDVTFKHILLPVWIAAYEYQGKVYQYLVNGQTGKTHGTAPWSWIKISLAVVAVLLIVGVIAYFAQTSGGGGGGGGPRPG